MSDLCPQDFFGGKHAAGSGSRARFWPAEGR